MDGLWEGWVAADDSLEPPADEALVRAFGLGQAWEERLGVLDEPALIELIIAGVRARLVA